VKRELFCLNAPYSESQTYRNNEKNVIQREVTVTHLAGSRSSHLGRAAIYKSPSREHCM